MPSTNLLPKISLNGLMTNGWCTLQGNQPDPGNLVDTTTTIQSLVGKWVLVTKLVSEKANCYANPLGVAISVQIFHYEFFTSNKSKLAFHFISELGRDLIQL